MAGPSSLSQEGTPSPTPDLGRGDRPQEALVGLPGVQPHLHCRTEACNERWEVALNRASFPKQTSNLQKMGISKINEADYCQLLKGT